MIIKSIQLKNFRQFIDEGIDFAQGENGKNVTIIIGENGTGKTTFAQAFFWCMYGDTSFSDKSMLNKTIEKRMTPGSPEEVSVSLCLQHGEVEYTLVRKQRYKKDSANKVTPDNTVFDIQIKDKTGNVTWAKKTQLENEVNGILPKELSRYFFFDGERIEKMSKDIAEGKKSSDFSDAVQGLLGLSGMKSALEHLNPRKKSCVIGEYESSFDAQGDERFQAYTNTINDCNQQLESLGEKIEQAEEEKQAAEQRRDEKREEIKQYQDGEKLQREREEKERQIVAAKKMRSQFYQDACKDFHSTIESFSSLALINRALHLLKDKDFTGIDIPHMHTDTIEYLLNRGHCICGTQLAEGTIPYQEVKKLIDVLPPQSISTLIGQFKKQSKQRVNSAKDLSEMLGDTLSTISGLNDDIIDYQDDLQNLDKMLDGKDVSAKVNQINNEIRLCTETIKKSESNVAGWRIDYGRIEQTRDRAVTEREELTLKDENNKRIARYLEYARAIYEDINNEYSASEKKVRDKLQKTINDLFVSIYEGGLSLSIDEKYHITVNVEDYSGNIETSTAQSISVIFAFITGIIKLARENRNSDDENAKLLSSEPYPLVMDAPLSAFDKRRIKTVCDALPTTAEQVVIFIKDTDGDLAEEYMGDYIGKRHTFNKLNEFETKLV